MNNGIKVLYQSPVLSDIVNVTTPPIQFNANGRIYNMDYYLADGIYLK